VIFERTRPIVLPTLLLLHLTDTERECAYDRHSEIGRLDKALDEANRPGNPGIGRKAPKPRSAVSHNNLDDALL
jgi:hypothetical protein